MKLTQVEAALHNKHELWVTRTAAPGIGNFDKRFTTWRTRCSALETLVFKRPETQLYDVCQLAQQRGYEIVEEHTDKFAVPRPGVLVSIN